MKMAGWQSPAQRTLHNVTTIATSAVSDTETLTNLLTTTDAPANSTEVETGSKLRSMVIHIAGTSIAGGKRTNFMVYRNKGGLEITSTSPIADYVGTTEPPTKVQTDIRKATLCPWFQDVRDAAAVTPLRKTFKCFFKPAMVMNKGDAIVLVHRANEAASRTFFIDWTAHAYK